MAGYFSGPPLSQRRAGQTLDRAEVVVIRGASFRAQNRTRIEQEVTTNP